MANLKTFRFEDAELATMQAQIDSEDLPIESQVHFRFALGKALEDRRNFASAFEHYDSGNALRRQRESYDPVYTEVLHDRIIATFTREFFEQRSDWGELNRAPIFIVGLPRSGSTLLEQILASHSQVEGTFELPELPRVIRSINRSASPGTTYPEAVAA